MKSIDPITAYKKCKNKPKFISLNIGISFSSIKKNEIKKGVSIFNIESIMYTQI